MRITRAAGVALRLVLLVMAAWLLVGLAVPTPDPFVVALGWLLLIAAVAVLPAGRRVASRWVATGRLRDTSA